MVPTSLAFNADLGTISTTAALTAIGRPLAIINRFVLNEIADYAERRDILLPTAHLMMTGTIMMSSRTRDMLGTKLVTQGNEGGSVMVFFLFFLPLMDLLFLPLHMGTTSHGHPCDSF